MRLNLSGQLVEPSTVMLVQSKASTGERHRLVAQVVEPIQRLPESPTLDADMRANDMMDRESEHVRGGRLATRWVLNCLTEQQPKPGSACPELRCGREREIDLQRSRQQEDPIHRLSDTDIEQDGRRRVVLHEPRPVREDIV